MTDKELLELLKHVEDYKGRSKHAYIRGLIKLLDSVDISDEPICSHNCKECKCGPKLVKRR